MTDSVGGSTPGAAPAAIQEQITDYWNFRAASYDAEPHHNVRVEEERSAWTGDLRALLPPPPAAVLDVGAGTGFLSILLAGMGYRVTGLDPAAEMLAAARRKSDHLPAPPSFQVGDGHAPPFPAASFDAVTSRHLLWTLRDPAGAFAAWYRVLRPGGRVVAIDSLWFVDEQQPDPEREPPVYAAAWAEHQADLERGAAADAGGVNGAGRRSAPVRWIHRGRYHTARRGGAAGRPIGT